MAKVIYTPGAAYGGHEYEARQEGDIVRIYERKPAASRFAFRAALTLPQWQNWYSTIAHDSTNPSHISRLADSRA